MVDFLQYYGLLKDLLSLIIRKLRGKDAATRSPVENPIVTQMAWDEANRGLRVPKGFQCAFIQAGVVQAQLGEGRYTRGELRRIAHRKALTRDARAVLYPETEFPLSLAVRPLFTSDHHELSLEFRAHFRVSPAHLLNSAEQGPLPLRFKEKLEESLMRPAREWTASLSGEEIVQARGMESVCQEKVSGWITREVEGSSFSMVRVSQARLCSEFLNGAYRKLEEIAQERGNLALVLERDRVRGSCRQAILAGRLREFADEERFEDAVRALEQDRALKEKALQMELEQHELDELQNRIELWRRKYDLLQQALNEAAAPQESSHQVIEKLCKSLELKAVGSADSPFSPQEQEQIRALLRTGRQGRHTAEEILSSISQNSGIRYPSFNPFAGLEGSHTLKVGEGWRIFDGENLWQVRLNSIETCRHGFLWLRERPSQACFEIKGSPGGRRLLQEVDAGGVDALHLGSRDLPVALLEGSAAQITLKVLSIKKTGVV